MGPVKTNAKTTGWSLRYRVALRKHLAKGQGETPRIVQTLGRQAVALGLETLDLAKTHEKALSDMLLPDISPKARRSTTLRAREFFAEAAVRIERTHRAALEADRLIRKLSQTLRERTQEASASTRRLTQSILQRQRAEAALKKSRRHHAVLLGESHRLLQHVRQLTYACLAAQEVDRKKVSLQLRDDIAQGLLGIHVQLLTLKKAMRISAEAFEKEIGTTQRLVRESNREVKRFAHEYGIHVKA